MAEDRLDGALERSPLLRLPYDIRVEIYRHLFPRNPQLHLMADKQGLSIMLARGELPMNIFTVCRELHSEASGHLYNNYLFNVVGLTSDCIARYEPLQRAVRRHARSKVKTDVLDNGLLSSTACISIYVSGGFVEGIAHSRRRGVPRELSDVKLELANTAYAGPSAIWSSIRLVLDGARMFRNCLLGMLLEQPLWRKDQSSLESLVDGSVREMLVCSIKMSAGRVMLAVHSQSKPIMTVAMATIKRA